MAGGDQVQWLKIIAAICVILGHNYTCWLKFKGGKGIATSAGVLAALVLLGAGHQPVHVDHRVCLLTTLCLRGLDRRIINSPAGFTTYVLRVMAGIVDRRDRRDVLARSL